MIRSRRTLIVIPALVVSCSWSAMGDYANPPGWDDDTDFTHQIWDFNTNAVPLVAEANGNPFGDPTMTNVYLCSPEYMFWDPDAMGHAIGRYGMWGGMPFGCLLDEVAMSMTFAVPNNERPEPWFKDLWIQVVYWGSIGESGEVLTVEVAHDSNFQNLYITYEAVADDIEDISTSGVGSSGQFWRFTHAFALEDQPEVEYVRVGVIPADSAAIFIDQVSIDTRCVYAGDFDGDLDVDLADYALFQRCFTGPGVAPTPECEVCDLERNNDVDLDDYAIFVSNLTGPGGGGP